MEIFKALIVAICVSCGSTGHATEYQNTTALTAQEQRSLECFASEKQIRQLPGEYKTARIRHHRTPNGTCYHIGPKNHSGVFTSTKTYERSVSGSSKTMEVRKKVDTAFPDWNSGASVVMYRHMLTFNWDEFHRPDKLTYMRFMDDYP